MGTKMFSAVALIATFAVTALAQPAARPPTPPALPAPGHAKPDFDIPKPDGPSGPAQPASGAAPLNTEGYVIGPQDNLSITVVDESDLTGKWRVDTDGTITFPYLNRIAVAGLTLADAQGKIATLLRTGQFLKNPQVRVEIDQFKSRKVTVTGEVRTPGPITMTGTTLTLLEALAMAGSPTSNASNDVIVQHKSKVAGESDPAPIVVNKKDLELGRSDITLQDADVINIPIAKRFYISGFVKNPGSFVLDTGTTISQAIILAGGLAERGTDRRIKVMRVVNGKTVEVSVELDNKVQPNDEIKIAARFF